MKTKLLSLFLLSSFALGLSGCNNTTTYTVTFDPNGGKMEKDSLVVNSGSTLELPIPYKKGKKFLGWFTGWESEDKEYTNTTPFTSNVSLIAKWKTYDVTFLDGNKNVFATEEVNAGSTVNQPDSDPGKKASEDYCYYFSNWDFDFQTKINSDITIKSEFESTEITWHDYIFPGSTPFSIGSTMGIIEKDNLFENSTKFDRNIALYTFSLSIALQNYTFARSYFQELGLKDLYYSSGEKDIAFVFGHKTFDDVECIFAIVRGTSGGKEWSRDFEIGKEGIHNGFFDSSVATYTRYVEYLNQHKTSNCKAIVTGYSRGAAVAGLVAKDLIDNNIIPEDRLFAYTFESPNSIPSSLLNREYNSIFNVYNSADLVAALPPYQYDNFTRPGKDVDIFKDNIDKYLKEVNPNLVIPSLSSSSPYRHENELPGSLIDKIVGFNSETVPTMRTREEYVDNYQPLICSMIELYFSLSQQTKNKITESISKEDTLSLLLLFTVEDALFDKLNPFIKDDGVTYDEEALRANCNLIAKATIGGPLGGLITDIPYMNRIPYMHAPEINYSLLLYY